MENLQSIDDDEKQLIFSEKIIRDLNESSRWGTFISAFAVFVSIFSMIFYTYFISKIWKRQGISFSRFFDEFQLKAVVVFIMIVGIIVLYFLSCYALWLFSEKMKKAIELRSSIVLETAITQLFKFFQFNGIIGIAIIFIYLFYQLEIYPFNK